MSEISRGVNMGETVGGANHTGFQDTHARVKETSIHRHSPHISLSSRDFHNGILENLLGGEKTKLNTNHTRRGFIFTSDF
jgi:hypothetical protein